MPALPTDFDAWCDAVATAPEALAQQFCREVETLPEVLRRASLIELKSERELAGAFRDAPDDGLLGGVPYLAKDLYDLKNVPTRAGSVFLETVLENPTQDAQLVQEFARFGAVCAGKTQMVEFAYGMTGENPHYGDCPHPFIEGALAGGSSSGSAWAVGRGLVPLAFGTDTAGSIRVPAAFCGVFGLRLVPEHCMQGVFPLAPSFDTVGWFTNNARDMHTLCAVLFSSTGKDARARALYVGDAVEFVQEDLRLACLTQAQALQAQEDPELGQWLKYSWQDVGRAYFMLSSAEAACEHAEWLDIMRGRYDPQVWERLNQGRSWSEDELTQARVIRECVCSRFRDYFETYDALVLPITPIASPLKSQMSDALRQSLLTLNTAVSLAGLPALSVPVKLPDGRSGGLQVVFPSLERMDVAPWLERLG